MLRVLPGMAALRGHLLACALAAPLLAAPAAKTVPSAGSCQERGFVFDTLPAPPGASTTATAINNRGQIIGVIAPVEGPSYLALWEDDTTRDLTPPGLISIAFRGINDKGQILGAGTDENAGQSVVFILDQGQLTPLPLPSEYVSIDPIAINDSGFVVGEAGIEAGPPYNVAVVWRHGAWEMLPAPAGETGYGATAINDRGEVAGYVLEGPGGMRQAVVWGVDSVRHLGVRTPVYSMAWDINATGDAVGWYKPTVLPETPPFMYPSRPVYWRTDTTIDLGTLGGDSASAGARAINAHGQIVGGSWIAAVPPLPQHQSHAFLWENGVMTDIHREATVSEAIDINDSGVIIGNATFPDSDRQRAVRWRLEPFVPPGEEIAMLEAKVRSLEDRGLLNHGKSASLHAKLASVGRKLAEHRNSQALLHLQIFATEAGKIEPALPAKEAADLASLTRTARCRLQ